MRCDVCGKEAFLNPTQIEGVDLSACEVCAKMGTVVYKKILNAKMNARLDDPEIVAVVVEEYATLIKQAREKKGWTQDELAKQLNEKLSQVHKIESGHVEPNVAQARKLESILRIHIIDEVAVKREHVKSKPGEPLTIGDLIKIKKR